MTKKEAEKVRQELIEACQYFYNLKEEAKEEIIKLAKEGK